MRDPFISPEDLQKEMDKGMTWKPLSRALWPYIMAQPPHHAYLPDLQKVGWIQGVDLSPFDIGIPTGVILKPITIENGQEIPFYGASTSWYVLDERSPPQPQGPRPNVLPLFGAGTQRGEAYQTPPLNYDR